VPRVVAALPVAVCADAGVAHRTADEIFARYAGFDNYRRLLDREGVSAPGGVAIVGDEAAVQEQVRGLSDLGVTELWPIVFPVGDDAVGSRRQTRALLAELATATPAVGG